MNHPMLFMNQQTTKLSSYQAGTYGRKTIFLRNWCLPWRHRGIIKSFICFFPVSDLVAIELNSKFSVNEADERETSNPTTFTDIPHEENIVWSTPIIKMHMRIVNKNLKTIGIQIVILNVY